MWALQTIKIYPRSPICVLLNTPKFLLMKMGKKKTT